MPLARRKKVLPTQDNPAILETNVDLERAVFYLPQTGEIFLDYESYAARLSFYRLRVFQCEVTGKGGLNYFEALESEKQEAKTLHSRFPEQLKAAVLRSVQWQIMGRVDHLVEAVYERFKDRYFEGERVFIDLQGEKYWARITNVYPPKKAKPVKVEVSSASTSSSSTPEDEREVPVHRIEGDLKIPASEINKEDDPKQYIYKVQLIEDGHGSAHMHGKEPKWGGSIMEVQSSVMSRDRLAFSKSILRRFIRDYVDRDSAVASPWTVKRSIAEKYGLDVVMPEATRKGVEQVKRGEIEKRKKAWEDKLEGPPSKKVKKISAEEKEKMEEEARIEAERLKVEKDARERARQAIHGTKKPTKYPTEDLDVKVTDKEKQKGKAVQRPPLDLDLPFEGPGVFETFLMSWNFLNTFGKPLNLSTFTLDEYENAIKHSQPDTPCTLISELHSCLLYMCRGLTVQRHSAVLSLLELKETAIDEDGVISIDTLVDAMADFGNGWERMSLKASEGREGWEEALVGCLKDLATTYNFPRLRQILTALLFAPDPSQEEDSGEYPPASLKLTTQSTPAERYSLLPDSDKIAIIGFLCDIAVNNRNIHAHLEWAETQLTELRKEKVEVNRERKRLAEEMNELGDVKEAASVPVLEPDVSVNESSISDVDSEKASEAANSDISMTGGGGRSSRQRALRIKVQGIAHAKQRELARSKTASAKQALAEHRKLDEELNKQERRVEAIEREFRQLLGIIRLKSMGKDRFHNRIWWFDGLGGGTLVNGSGSTSYGTGRIFIQGPSQQDWEMMSRREDSEEIMERFHEEQGEVNALGVGDWGVYSQPEQLTEYIAWLNPRGNREFALINQLNRWQDHILSGMKKRLGDVDLQSRLPEARRSTRTKSGPENRPYMLWQNRKVNVV